MGLAFGNLRERERERERKRSTYRFAKTHFFLLQKGQSKVVSSFGAFFFGGGGALDFLLPMI